MSPAMVKAIRAIVVAAGVVLALASLSAFRLEDAPIYAAYVLLSIVLYRPRVEILPGLELPVPGLALSIGFLYVGGLPILALTNLGSALVLIARAVVPARWRDRVPELRGAGTDFVARMWSRDLGAWADWAAESIGLGTRWATVLLLGGGATPVTDAGTIVAAEIAGYVAWTLLTVLPVFSFRTVLHSRLGAMREIRMDLGLIMVLALTPFVFLIVYGYELHGLGGAAAWALSALGLHFMLKRLNERRVTVEDQNRRLQALNRELEHRERLSAIGKMSSVVSHQILQQLGVIGIYADLIRNVDRNGDAGEALREARANAAAIEGALGSVNDVLRDLLVFSKDLRVHLYEHPLAGVVEESVEACRAEAEERGVVVRAHSEDGSLRVPLDKLKIKQALVNLLRNAIEASPAGAEVVLCTEQRDGEALISVADRGSGIVAADRDRVFTPFFTTKEQGTGLGLAIAREFVEAHGGTLAVSSDGGRGATFLIRLPVVREDAMAPCEPGTGAPPQD
jgi:signal transduction histidine kinase